MNRKILLIAFFLVASLGVYMEVASWRDTEMVTIKWGARIFHIPERNSLERWLAHDPFGTRSLPGLRPGGPATNLYISAEEIARLVDGYQVADGEIRGDVIWLVRFVDEQALDRMHTPDPISSAHWHQTEHMENSMVSRYKKTGFYRMQASGDDVFWTLTRMPPQPDQPLPPKSEFLVAFCNDELNRRTEAGHLTSCRSWFLHQNLYVTFHIYGFNLHLVDEVRDALVRKLEEWQVRPASGS